MVRVDRAVGKGRGGEEWRNRGMEGETREEVDFAPLARIPAGAHEQQYP